MRTFRFILMLACMVGSSVHAQFTALPFLQIGTSLSGNGMGEVRGTLNNGSTLMSTFNPGLLGVSSFDTQFSAETFDRHAAWLPAFHMNDLWIHSTAVTLGTIINDGTGTAIPIAAGIGYTNTFLSLGDFVVTSEDGSNIQHYTGYDRVDGVSAGAAIRYGVTAGAGVNVKRVVSSDGSNASTPWMMDLGIFVDAPLIPETYRRIDIDPSFALITESGLSCSYVYSNIGGDVHYGSSQYSDPLPREITAGMALRAGWTAEIDGKRFPLLSGTVVREANDLAVRRSDDGNQWTFQSGLDYIDIGNNLLLGNATPNITLRRGSEYTVMGLVSFRSGTNRMPHREFITTSGQTIHIHGLFPFLRSLSDRLDKDPVIGYLLNHLQISYVTSSYESIGVLNNTSFSGFVIGLH